MRRALFLATLASLAVPALAAGQDSGWDGRVRIGINGGIQTSDNAIHQAFTLQKNLEGTPITADIAVQREPLFDAGLVVRIRGRFGVGVAVSYAMRDINADVTAQIPHPFFFSQPRAVTGTAAAGRTETTTHIDAVWMVPSRKVDVLLSVGPSLFNVTQTLITDVLYADAYPYDAATFGSAPTATARRTATGFHVGADVTVKLSAHVGVGGLLRFSRASATFTAGTDNSVTTDLGGLQAGGGVRIGF